MTEFTPVNKEYLKPTNNVLRSTRRLLETLRQKTAQEIVDGCIPMNQQFTTGEVVVSTHSIGRHCSTECDHHFATITSAAYFIDDHTIGYDLSKPGKHGYKKLTPGRLLFRDIEGAWQRSTIDTIQKIEASDFIEFPE